MGESSSGSGIPLSLEYFLDLETVHGKVRNFRLLNNHFLVYKIPMGSTSSGREGAAILLPNSFTRKATKNLVVIKAFVLRSTAPFIVKSSRRVWKRDVQTGEEKLTYKVTSGTARIPTDVLPGDCIIYNGYNVGKVECRDLPEPLTIVRGIDIDAVYPPGLDDTVEVGDHAMGQKAYW